MNSRTVVAVILMVFGAIVLAYSGLYFTTPGPTVDVFGLHIQTVDNHYLPPIFGTISLLVGLAIFLVRPRRATL